MASGARCGAVLVVPAHQFVQDSIESKGYVYADEGGRKKECCCCKDEAEDDDEDNDFEIRRESFRASPTVGMFA